MRRHRLSSLVASIGCFGGLSLIQAPPVSAATCSIRYLRVSVFTNGYLNDAYIFGPIGRTLSDHCIAIQIEVLARPAVVGSVPRVATPGGCNSPDPSVAMVSPNDAECSTLLGYGGAGLGTTSYPYVTLTGVATAIGSDGSRSVWSRSCTVQLPEPDFSDEFCRWGNP